MRTPQYINESNLSHIYMYICITLVKITAIEKRSGKKSKQTGRRRARRWRHWVMTFIKCYACMNWAPGFSLLCIILMHPPQKILIIVPKQSREVFNSAHFILCTSDSSCFSQSSLPLTSLNTTWKENLIPSLEEFWSFNCWKGALGLLIIFPFCFIL